MGTERLKKAYGDYLNTLNIHVLRNVARRAGVYKPTDGKKENLIERTIEVLTGEVLPVPPSNRGAPLKEDTLDPKYMRELERIREEFSLAGENVSFENTLSVQSGEERGSGYESPLSMGVLEIMPNGCGFLRVKNCRPEAEKDIFVSSQNIRAWRLREGDYVVGHALRQAENNHSSLVGILSVNADTAYLNRRKFEDFSVGYPEEKIELSKGNRIPSLRYSDLFFPIGKGQRAIVCASPSADADSFLKDVARAVRNKMDSGENLRLLVLLIDERPEEVTEFFHIVSDEIVYTTFDMDAQAHLRAARLVFSRAKRLAEQGEDVVLLLNSLTRLTRAADVCTASERVLPCGLGASAFNFPKACLSAAGNLNGGGSVTVLAACAVADGDAADAAIYAEFEKICNCRIVFSRKLAEKYIFPAIDVKNSYTCREEKLQTPEELECARYTRGNLLNDNGETLHSLFEQTSDNAAFMRKIKTLQ